MSDDQPQVLSQPSGSPLLEADPKSLDLLMDRMSEINNKPPLDLTTEGPGNDLEVVVMYYRRLRAKHLNDEIEAANKPRETRRKAPSSKPRSVKEAMSGVLDLGDEE